MNTSESPRTSTSPSRNRRIRATITVLVIVAGCLAAGAATVATAAPGTGFSHESLQVAIVSEDGSIADPMRQAMDVGGMAPGMPARRSTLELRNSGTTPATFDLSITDLRPQGRRSLEDVLVVTVLDAEDGSRSYRGRLSKLAVIGSRVVAPGSSVSYDVTIAWPQQAGLDANEYQGAGISFSLEATAKAVTR